MKGDKVPGLEGCQAFFNQHCWHVVGSFLTKFIQKTFRSRNFLVALNETLIVLIPKINHPDTVNHFRLMFLCNVIYNLITKIVVQRIRPLLLVSQAQCNFIPRRQVRDNIVVVQEAIHAIRRMRGRKEAIAVKIYLEKA